MEIEIESHTWVLLDSDHWFKREYASKQQVSFYKKASKIGRRMKLTAIKDSSCWELLSPPNTVTFVQNGYF